MTPLRITRGVQSLQRLQHIARVLTQHGFGHVVEQLHLRRFVPLWLRRKPMDAGTPIDGHSAIGRRLRRVATDLGPIYVKLGQMIATRPDIVPPDILAELTTLQDRVEPFASAAAREIIAEELRKPVFESFTTFNDTPIASGSIGQVYQASLPDGRQVVVKVQRPRIEAEVRADLQLLRWLAEALERWVAESRAYRPTVLVEEFERTLKGEMDFLREAAVTARFRDALSDDPMIDVPEVIWSHTTSRVLTLGAVFGENIDRALEHDGRHFNRPALAKRLADLYLRQFFEFGTFHADPHAGNLLVTPPARIALIDFGQTGVVSDATAGHLLILLIGVVAQDVELVADILMEMGTAGPRTDRAQLTRDLKSLLERYYGQPIQRLKLSKIFAEVAEAVRRHDLTIPQDVVLMLKAFTTVWGLALRLDPELDLVALLKPKLAGMVRDRLSPSRVARNVGVTTWHLLSFLRAAPQQFREMLRQFASGKWQLNVRHENLEQFGREVDRSGNRLALSIVIASLVISSSMVVTSDTQVKLFGVGLQTFGLIGYVLAGIFGVGLVVAILRSGRLS